MDDMYDSVIELPAEVELPKDEQELPNDDHSHPIENKHDPIEPVMSLQEQHSFGTLVDRYKRKRIPTSNTPSQNSQYSNDPLRDQRSSMNEEDQRRVVSQDAMNANTQEVRNKPRHVEKPFSKNKHSFHSKRGNREEHVKQSLDVVEPKQHKSFTTKHSRDAERDNKKTFHTKPKPDRGPIACVFSKHAANYLRDVQEMDEITSAWHSPEGLLAYMRTFKNPKSIFLVHPTDAQLNALARHGYKTYCLQ